jgi:hypothetical protein
MDETKSLFGPPGVEDIGWLYTYRRVALCALAAAIALSVLAPGLLAWPAALGMSASLLFWCALDARVHEKPFPGGIAMALAMTWPIGIAVYLVWTRGLWAGLVLYVFGVMGFGFVLVAASLAKAFL